MITAMSGTRAEVFGLGRFQRGGELVDFEIGWPEFARDVAWARRMLAAWRVAAGDHVVLTTPNWEGPWASPLIHALRELGTVHSNAEPYTWDARRTSTFLRWLPVRAIIGMSEEAAVALVADASNVALLAKVPLLWARPEALGVLRDAGVRPAGFAKLGPALGLECPEKSGLHLDPAEWRVGPGLTLSTVGERAYRAVEVPLGVDGHLDQSPCACGLPGARVRLD